MDISQLAYHLHDKLFDNGLGIFLLFCGVFALVVITLLMSAIGIARQKGLKTPNIDIPEDNFPKVSLVLCTKGVRPSSLETFCRNLSLKGFYEFIFVVESKDDPAYDCVMEAIERCQSKARVEIAGCSFHNAQKIHSMLCGLVHISPESDYVFFVDDDVYLFPGLIEQMVYPLITEPDKVLVSTGYEFCLPTAASSIPSYSLMVYRLHNLWSFITDRPILCWGGSWLAPMDLFRSNNSKILDTYIDGGYSDDTLISCLIQEKGYKCAHPYRALYANVPNEKMTFHQYWEFIVRQFFVLGVYSTPYNKRVSHSLAYLIVSSVWLLAVWSIYGLFGCCLVILAIPTNLLELKLSTILPVLSAFLWLTTLLAVKFSTSVMTEVSNSVKTPEFKLKCDISLWRLFVGILVHILMLPPAVIYAVAKKDIMWAGVKYTKCNGKIVKVERYNDNGQTYTIPLEDSVKEAILSYGFKMSEDGIVRM